MGDLLHILRDDQRRMEEAAETIPGLAVKHFDAPAQSPRAEMLMAINAEQRELIETLTERNDALARRVADQAAEIADLKRQMRILSGDDYPTKAGEFSFQHRIGPAKVIVLAVREPGEWVGMNYVTARTVATHVVINGQRVEAADLIHLGFDELDNAAEKVAADERAKEHA